MAEVRREYYSTGELRKVWFEINGKKEGEYLSYYSNGQLRSTSTVTLFIYFFCY